MVFYHNYLVQYLLKKPRKDVLVMVDKNIENCMDRNKKIIYNTSLLMDVLSTSTDHKHKFKTKQLIIFEY